MIVFYVSCNFNEKFLLKRFTFCIINEIERGIVSNHSDMEHGV